MPFKEHVNPKDAMTAIGKGLTAAERGVLAARVLMPRPKWADDHVVDPAWRHAHPDAVTKETPEPFSLLGNEQVKQLDLLFDPKLFEPNNDIQRGSSALDLLGAVIDLLEDVVEIADANPAALTSARALEAALAPNLQTLVNKVRGLTTDAIDKADDELDRHAFVRGIFEHYIMQDESDLSAYELLEVALDDLDDADLARYDLMSIPPTPVRVRS